MSWLFYALAAPAIYAAVVFVDKYLLSKEIKDYRGMPLYSALVALIVGTIFWVYADFPILSLNDTTLVVATGILTELALVAYFKAISLEEASNINIFFQSFPVVVLVLSYLFLGEQITTSQFIGFVIILASVIIASWKKGEMLHQKNIKSLTALGLITLHNVLLAIAAILMKYSIEKNSFWHIFNYQSWGVFLGGFLIAILSPSIRDAFFKMIKHFRLKVLIIVFVNECFFILARAFTYLAFSLGVVALVSVLEGTQVFFGIIFGVILSMLFPKIFKESTQSLTLAKKIVTSSLLLLGIVMIY